MAKHDPAGLLDLIYNKSFESPERYYRAIWELIYVDKFDTKALIVLGEKTYETTLGGDTYLHSFSQGFIDDRFEEKTARSRASLIRELAETALHLENPLFRKAYLKALPEYLKVEDVTDDLFESLQPLEVGERATVLGRLTYQIAKKDAAQASGLFDLMFKHYGEQPPEEIFANSLRAWLSADFNIPADFVNTLKPGPTKDKAAAILARRCYGLNELAAMEQWLRSIQNPAFYKRTVAEMHLKAQGRRKYEQEKATQP